MSCRSSKTVTQQTSTMAATDTLRQTAILTVYDTVRETTTITIQTNATGDTTRLTTITDREKIKNSDRTATTLNHQTTQTETTSNTEESTMPIQPISPIQPINLTHQIKLIAISFILGFLLIPLIKLCRRLKN